MLHGGLTDLLCNPRYNFVMQTREKLNKQGKMVWLNGVDNADPFLLPYDSDCAADYGQCGWWKNPSPGAGCAAFFRSRCANETYGSVDLGVLRAGSWGLSIATLLLLRQERGWLVSDWWQGTSSIVPLAWSDDLDRDVGVPSQRHCVEDPGQPGVFERRWSGGMVSVNCSDLSVHLPGKTPVKTDDEPPPHPPALLSKDPACAEQCGECGCTPEKGDRSGNDIWSGVLADEAACCTHCRTLPTAVVYTWDTSGGKVVLVQAHQGPDHQPDCAAVDWRVRATVQPLGILAAAIRGGGERSVPWRLWRVQLPGARRPDSDGAGAPQGLLAAARCSSCGRLRLRPAARARRDTWRSDGGGARAAQGGGGGEGRRPDGAAQSGPSGGERKRQRR